MNPSVGARTVDGSAENYADLRNTSEKNNIGDVVKYVNLHIQAGHRGTDDVSLEKDRGFIEWALVCVKETETAVPNTNMGTMTLGTVCTNMFRGECIYTGMFPIGLTQPNVMSTIIKIPKHKQTIKIGDEWRFITYYRNLQATATDTDTVRIIKSYNWKNYE